MVRVCTGGVGIQEHVHELGFYIVKKRVISFAARCIIISISSTCLFDLLYLFYV